MSQNLPQPTWPGPIRSTLLVNVRGKRQLFLGHAGRDSKFAQPRSRDLVQFILHRHAAALPFAALALNIPSANLRNAASGLRMIAHPPARHLS